MTTEPITCNAVIKSASLQLDNGAFLSMWLDLDYGNGSGQGFGGYVLGALPDCAAGKHESHSNIAAEFIVRCFIAAGVEKFNELAGKTIRVKKPTEWGGILAIGHIVKDDCWFNPQETFDRMPRKL